MPRKLDCPGVLPALNILHGTPFALLGLPAPRLSVPGDESGAGRVTVAEGSQSMPDIRKTMTNNEALHFAINVGMLDDLAAALAAGADPDARDAHGFPALWQAAARGMLDTMELLASHGARFELPNNDGETPLHAAAGGGQVRAVKFLLELGANPNSGNLRGETPLHDTALGTHHTRLEIAAALLEHGADVNAARPSDGLTALGFAREFASRELVEFLLAHGAK